MTSDFTGFNFLPSSMHPVSDIRRGYVATSAAVPDTSTTGKAGMAGAVITADTTAGHGVTLAQPLLRLDF